MTSPHELVELQHAIYESKNPTRRWLHTTRKAWITAAIEKYSRRAGMALEIGPGSGIYLPVLARNAAQVVAVDIENAYLDQAKLASRSLANLEFRLDDITRSSLTDDSFDLILCTEVIEHIADSAAALKEIGRILKPGGIAIISTPQKYSPLELTAKIAFMPGIINIVRLIYNEPVLETGHINLLTQTAAREQITAAQLQIIQHDKSGVYIPFIAEFTGKLGLKFEAQLEKALNNTVLDWLLWTQYYITRKPSDQIT